MNKTELAKLLFQHKGIKALFESQEFDASTINKVIAQEVMRESEDDDEQEGSGWSTENEKNQGLIDKMQEELEGLESTKQEFLIRLKDIKQDIINARVARDKEARIDAAQEKKYVQQDLAQIQSKIDAIQAKLAQAGQLAAKTPSPKDDVAITKVTQQAKSELEQSTSDLDRTGGNEEVVANIQKDVEATITNLEEPIQQVAQQSAAAADEETGDDAGAEETPPTPPAEDTPIDAPTWRSAKAAARKKVTEDVSMDQIVASLENQEAFKAFWGVTGDVSGKMTQAQKLFEDEYFQGRIADLKAKAQAAKDESEAAKVKDDSAGLAATVMSYVDYLNKFDQQPNAPLPTMDFPSDIPEDEGEFQQQFIAPLEAEETDQESGATEQGYMALGQQVIAQSDDLLSDFAEDQAIVRFLGYYAGAKSKEAANLEEDTGKAGIEQIKDEYRAKINDYDKLKDVVDKIGSEPDRWNDIFEKLDQLISTGQISIDKPEETEETDDTKLIAQQQEEALQEKADVSQDEDLTPLATEEMDTAWKDQLDHFFGKNPTKSSFMKQILLRRQGEMLAQTIATLNQIIEGNRGGEAAALTDQETQVKVKDSKPLTTDDSSAGNEQQQDTADATGANPAPEDEENKAQSSGNRKDNMEEQVINEIFGMFGKKEEPEEIEFSRESTKNMRQDLEAMVDLLRSLKIDIGDYDKFGTRNSVDPRFDGSTLKKALDAKLAVVQKRIGLLIKKVDIGVQDQASQLETDAAKVAGGLKDLEEALSGLFEQEDDSERKLKIQEVRRVYDEMRRMYLQGLQVSLEENDSQEAKQGAKQIKDYVLGEKEFMGYFPTNVISSTGQVMTLSEANNSMKAIIQSFIGAIRDMVTITKTQKVSPASLEQAVGELVKISEAIERLFNVPSEIDREFMQKYIDEASAKPENQPISDEEPQRDGEEEGGGLLASIKNWFQENAGKVLNFLGEKFLDLLSTKFEQEDMTEEEQEEIQKEIAEDVPWIKRYSEPEGMAIAEFSKNLMEIAVQNQALKEQIEIPNTFKQLMSDIASRVALLDEASIEEDMIGAINMIEEEDRQQAILKIMRDDALGLSRHISLMYKLGPELGKEFLEEVTELNAAPSPSSGLTPSVDNLTNLNDKEKDQLKKQIDALVNTIATSIVPKLEEGLLKEISEPRIYVTNPKTNKRFLQPFEGKFKEKVMADPNGEMQFVAKGEPPFSIPKSEILNVEAVASTLVIIKSIETDNLEVYESLDPVVEKIKAGTYTGEEFLIREFGDDWEKLGESSDEYIRAALSGEEVSTDNAFVSKMMEALKSENVNIEPSVLETFEKDNPDFVPLLKKAASENPNIYAEIAKRVAKERSPSNDAVPTPEAPTSDEKSGDAEQTSSSVDGFKRAGYKVQPKRTFVNTEGLETSLKPIIEKMLKEHYNK